MKTLYNFITEGGAAGHMAHPYDYAEYTLRDLKGLIRNLFLGRIEDVTEKIDGTNIVASMNNAGEVVFIRNKTDLNSEKGGMSITDMATKWADKPGVANTFTTAGKIIEKVFNNINKSFFNPDKNTRIAVNCECVVTGKTNIMPYASDQVDFHNLFIYKHNGSEWEHVDTTKEGLDVVNKACEKIDSAQLTPQIIIKTNEESNKILVDFIKDLDRIWKDGGLKEHDTIESWKQSRFESWCEDNAPWILGGDWKKLYDRWFNGIKSFNIKRIKQEYSGHDVELNDLDKSGYKKIIGWVTEPLDTFFGKLGNKIISLCDGIINDGCRDVVVTDLKKEVTDVTNYVEKNGSIEAKDKLSRQLDRLSKLNNELNPVEGIVFKYKGKLQKLTGSFGALNQCINIKYMDMTK